MLKNLHSLSIYEIPIFWSLDQNRIHSLVMVVPDNIHENHQESSETDVTTYSANMDPVSA